MCNALIVLQSGVKEIRAGAMQPTRITIGGYKVVSLSNVFSHFPGLFRAGARLLSGCCRTYR